MRFGYEVSTTNAVRTQNCRLAKKIDRQSPERTRPLRLGPVAMIKSDTTPKMPEASPPFSTPGRRLR